MMGHATTSGLSIIEEVQDLLGGDYSTSEIAEAVGWDEADLKVVRRFDSSIVYDLETTARRRLGLDPN